MNCVLFMFVVALLNGNDKGLSRRRCLSAMNALFVVGANVRDGSGPPLALVRRRDFAAAAAPAQS